MGKWRSIKELKEIIEKIKIDIPLFQIYNDDVIHNKTVTNFKKWLNNLKVRIKKYFNVDIRSFIPRWTKNNKVYQKNWELVKIRNMEDLKLKLENIFSELEMNASTLEIAQKLVAEFLTLSAKTIFDKNKIKVLLIYYWKKYNPKLKLRPIFKLLDIKKSVYYEHVKKINEGLTYERKIRYDSKVNNIEYQAKAKQIIKETKNRIGIDKCKYLFNNSEYKPDLTISVRTLAKIFRQQGIITNPGSHFIKAKKFKESKDTKVVSQNLLTKEFLTNSNPGEVFSIDYKIIKIGNKYFHILGAIDTVTSWVPYLKVFPNQSKFDVHKMLSSINNNKIKVVHADNGTEFKAYIIQEFCKINNILQSFSTPGVSTENRWIEYFWSRLEMECLTGEKDLENLSIERIQEILDDYKDFWNYQRPIKKFDYLTPSSKSNK